MSSTARPSRWHASPEARRAQVLEAALRCFAAKVYHAATMDDLVKASGLSKGSLHWHFRSKQDVLLALFDAFAEDLFADWDALEASDEPALDVFQQVADNSIRQLCTEPELLRAWIEFFTYPLARERLAEIYARTRRKMAVALKRDLVQGRIGDRSPEGLAATLTAVLEGLLLQAMVDPSFDIQANWPVAWDVIRRGIER